VAVIAVEGFAARETYRRVVNDALRRAKLDRPIRVTNWPPKGSGRGGGDALARSAPLLQGLETGTTRIAGHLPEPRTGGDHLAGRTTPARQPRCARRGS